MKRNNISFFARKAFQKLDPRRKLFLDSNDINKTVFIAGAARSGTTWLQNIVNYDGSYRVMFEPFRIEDNELVSHFKQRQYIRLDNKEGTYLEPVRKILSGQIRNSWVDKYNHKFFIMKRLVKDVRSTLFLKWLKLNFQNIPFIYIIRHPCSVALSRVERGFNTHLDVYLEQNDLIKDYLNPFLNLIQNTTDTFEKHILMWCIDNYLPLRQFKTGEIHVLFYENLCTNPETETRKIFDYLGTPIDLESKKLRKVIETPSLLSREGSAILAKKNSVDNWKKFVSKKQAEKTVQILQEFGLNHVYSENIMPLSDERCVFIAA